jgi:hypothetical protein
MNLLDWAQILLSLVVMLIRLYITLSGRSKRPLGVGYRRRPASPASASR